MCLYRGDIDTYPDYSRIYREDVTPCLDFPVAELAGRVRRAVQVMYCAVSYCIVWGPSTL